MRGSLSYILAFCSVVGFSTSYEEYAYEYIRPHRQSEPSYVPDYMRDDQFSANQRPAGGYLYSHNKGQNNYYRDSGRTNYDTGRSNYGMGRTNYDTERTNYDNGRTNYESERELGGRYRDFNRDEVMPRQANYGRRTYTATHVDMEGNVDFVHGSKPVSTARSYVIPDSQDGNVKNPHNGENRGVKRKLQDFDAPKNDDLLVSEQRTTKVIKTPIKSRNCSFNLCDEVDNYPTDKVLNIISRSAALKQYFSSQAITISFNSRDKFDDEGETLCQTKTQTRFPKSAKNTKNQEKLLVNAGDYQQGVVYETCGTDGGACKFSEFFPVNYVSTCKQKYVVRKLMVLEKETENTVFDNFEIPSCCICTLKQKV